MRRYGDTTDHVTVPGQNAGLKLTLQPLPEAPEPTAPCAPKPAGLFWFSDLTGEFSEDSEAAYLLAEGAAGPVLGVARVLGDTCGKVAWSSAWTPASGEGGAPGILEDGPDLIAYPLDTTAPGILEVSAVCAGKAFGPILLTVLRYSCYGYAYCPPQPVSNNLGGWLRLPDNFQHSGHAGPLETYGGADGAIQIGAGQVTTISFALTAIREVFVYCNDGGYGYFIANADGVQHPNQRGAFSSPWADAAETVPVAGLTSIEFHSDGYNAPFYVFVR